MSKNILKLIAVVVIVSFVGIFLIPSPETEQEKTKVTEEKKTIQSKKRMTQDKFSYYVPAVAYVKQSRLVFDVVQVNTCSDYWVDNRNVVLSDMYVLFDNNSVYANEEEMSTAYAYERVVCSFSSVTCEDVKSAKEVKIFGVMKTYKNCKIIR